jgi:hypothetical protein
MDISVVGEERRIVADNSASIRLFFAFSDGVKHSDMRKVYVYLLCSGFAMLCAFSCITILDIKVPPFFDYEINIG